MTVGGENAREFVIRARSTREETDWECIPAGTALPSNTLAANKDIDKLADEDVVVFPDGGLLARAPRTEFDEDAKPRGPKWMSEVLGKFDVLSEREVRSRYTIALEKYCLDINTEAMLALEIAKTKILPAAAIWSIRIRRRKIMRRPSRSSTFAAFDASTGMNVCIKIL